MRLCAKCEWNTISKAHEFSLALNTHWRWRGSRGEVIGIETAVGNGVYAFNYFLKIHNICMYPLSMQCVRKSISKELVAGDKIINAIHTHTLSLVKSLAEIKQTTNMEIAWIEMEWITQPNAFIVWKSFHLTASLIIVKLHMKWNWYALAQECRENDVTNNWTPTLIRWQWMKWSRQFRIFQ